ncbi:pYEATS domain-containing protein [Niastella sp. OAS944]|uniref:pYEATS domain-containing protein n=1 Tax=Niastella sp. OAS944 TaxID=2664089 RepID=UPI00346AEC01|nr:putative Rossmann-fold nucleotide-binding protein/methionine-rich copper-binding protein CopC [Chitinophagaceae bacterium OAS944]
MQQQENKRWDVADIPVQMDTNSTWGIPGLYIPDILNNLVALNLVKKTEIETGKLSFNQFRLFIAHLHQLKYNTNDLRTAVEKWWQVQKKDESSAENHLNRELQMQLATFVSPQLKEPFSITVDGIWGPESEHALHFINSTYNVTSLEKSPELLEVLRSISERIIRICCFDEWLISLLPYNPFCMIDNNAIDLELFRKGNGASLYEQATNREMVHFHSLASARGNVINTPFWQFTSWFMLLRMQSMNHYLDRVFQINIGDEWKSIEQLEKPSKTEFFIQPDRTMTFEDSAVRIPIQFIAPTQEPYYIIAAFFSRNLQVAITQELFIGMSNIWSLDSKGLFSDKKSPEDDGEVHFIQKADYCKIFVVNEGFGNDTKERYSNFPATDVPPEFYKLITANADDIFYSVTIGLVFNESKQPKPFNEKWVLVVGTGNKDVSEEQLQVAEALGKALAHAGYGLISGGWPYIDEAVTEAFNDRLESYELKVEDRLLQVITNDQKPDYSYGKKIKVKNDEEWNHYTTEKAIAVVMIGGEGGTYTNAVYAQSIGVPVIPIPSTGGDAQRLFNETPVSAFENIDIKTLGTLQIPLSSREDAEKTAMAVIDILNTIPEKVKKGLSLQEFRIAVEDLYKKRQVLFADDLQRGRWGQQDRDNGKRLYVEVKSTKDPDVFKLTLSVSSYDKTELSGYVAFFLHNSLEQEIEYTIAEKGMAKLEITTHEPFTVAAYTEDGTVLERNFNDIPRLAKGFNYISEKFKEEAGHVNESRKITVPDDPQKNRWGGQSEANGMQVKATVKDSLIRGWYNVTFEVSSTNDQKPFTGDAAFFLHNSFYNKILYRRSFDGKVKLSIVAYEAFTVGVYLPDGTTLELDLQQQQGYPDAFYYKD